jgi:hypothetical protein
MMHINIHKTMTKITSPKQVDVQLNTHSSSQTYIGPYKYDNWLISLPSWLLLKLLIKVCVCVCSLWSFWTFDFLWKDALLPHGVSRHLSLVEW